MSGLGFRAGTWVWGLRATGLGSGPGSTGSGLKVYFKSELHWV